MQVQTNNNAVTITIPNPTTEQMAMIVQLFSGVTKSKRGRKPLSTVSDDEDGDFATSAMTEEDLEEDADEEIAKPKRRGRSKASQALEDDENSDEDMEESDDQESDEDDDSADESQISFPELKAAINKYGEKYPDQMRAILLGFKIKSPKELSAKQNEKHWEPIYRKVMAKIKAGKKSK